MDFAVLAVSNIGLSGLEKDKADEVFQGSKDKDRLWKIVEKLCKSKSLNNGKQLSMWINIKQHLWVKSRFTYKMLGSDFTCTGQ